MAQGMFGPSAEETRLALQKQGEAEDIGWANMPAGRGPVRGMAQAGRQFGDAIEAVGGYEDPRMAKAKLMEEAKMEVDSSGVSLLDDPKSYYSKAFESLSKRGLTDEAAGVYNLLIESESAQAGTALKRAQAESELNKGQSIGAGGLRLPDGTIVPPERAPADALKNQPEIRKLQIAMQDPSLTEDERADLQTRIDKLKSKSGNSSLEILAGAIGKGAEAQVEAARLLAEAKEAGKGSEEYRNKIYEDADTAAAIISQLNTIDTTLKTTDMTFGALGETRRSIAGVVSLFAPDLANDLNSVMKFDTVAYDSVERASSNILTRLAQEAGGQRTNLLLKTLEKAGPGVWQTNEGLRIIALANRKTQQFKMDKANYLDTISPKDNVRQKLRQWTAENFNKPEYNITENEIRNIKFDEKKAKIINNLRKESKPLPPERELIVPNKIYYIENNPKYKDGYYKSSEKGLIPMSVE